MPMNPLSDIEMDAVAEIMNIGVGRAAASLNEIAREEILLSVPKTEILFGCEAESRLREASDNMVAILEDFSGIVRGTAALLFPRPKTIELVSMILDQESGTTEIMEMEQEALSEIGNIILNQCLSSLADAFSDEISTTVPVSDVNATYFDTRIQQGTYRNSMLLYLTINFSISSRDITGSIIFLMDMTSADMFRARLGSYVATLH